jgi:hypothetical protein
MHNRKHNERRRERHHTKARIRQLTAEDRQSELDFQDPPPADSDSPIYGIRMLGGGASEPVYRDTP